MPELPEVETVRRKLEHLVLNRTIKSVDVYYSKHQSLNVLKNEKINEINRLGKFLIFKLDHFFMISHLRMEGKYFIKEKQEVTKHDLVCFSLDDGRFLFYNDVRKFGVFYLIDINKDIYKEEPLNKLGKEPFTITKEELYSKLKNNNSTIKEALLDQSIISGIGNIYDDEILFDCKINPMMKAKDVKEEKMDEIINSSIKILNKSIEDGGSTIRSFTSLDEVGHFQTSLKVHLREGERCFNCGSYIIKTGVGGRGTYYCPFCEKHHDYKLIGITGGFSSGKSSFTKMISELGYKTFSLDEIYNDLLKCNTKMVKEINKHFNVTTKEELKKIVFNSEDKNKELMAITHKYVMNHLFSEIEKINDKLIFVEAPLLFEGGFEKAFDSIISVYRDEKDVIEASKKNGFNEEETKKRIASQMSSKEKNERSNFVVYNNTTLIDLKKKAKEIIKSYE